MTVVRLQRAHFYECGDVCEWKILHQQKHQPSDDINSSNHARRRSNQRFACVLEHGLRLVRGGESVFCFLDICEMAGSL